MPAPRLPCLALALAGLPAAWGQAAPAPAPRAIEAEASQRVEITGGRPDAATERRQSTAAKIVIGRDEIERQGDATLGELLKRLPGITVQGPPGRGGGIRMRGLGGGYTQILLDGQRVPPGFSLDSIEPDQVERIEILRAPTAETGARAIAGTINVILREGYRRRLNDLKLTAAYEQGALRPAASWSHNDSTGAWTYTLAVSANAARQRTLADSDTTAVAADGTPTLLRHEHAAGQASRHSVHMNTRLQWRGADGRSLVLMPMLIRHAGRYGRDATLEQELGSEPAGWARARTDGDWTWSLARLGGQWTQRVGEATRVELSGGAGRAESRGASLRREFAADGELVRTIDDANATLERRVQATVKATSVLASDHDLVAGVETEAARRSEQRTTLQDGVPLLPQFGEDIDATSRRLAVYLQDEWKASPQWALHAGLRWEGIRTRGDGEDGQPLRHDAAVATPLLHALWRPDPKSRDQVRISLTRSWRSPTLQNLIARPSISSAYPLPGANTPTHPDRAGNAALAPELAAGMDVAAERHLDGGGILSANVFVRRLRDFIRTTTELESVPWSPVSRWVARPRNVGGALTAGVELEAKFPLATLWPQAPRIDLRSNASLYRSRVDAVPGPDNRLDQQPSLTLNLGGDWRLRGLPLTLGANLNWTPAYDTRLSDEQSASTSRKRVVDAYALWSFDAATQLRLSASNLAPLDAWSASRYAGAETIETTSGRSITSTAWALRLEMKL